jgi:hypothetical protein
LIDPLCRCFPFLDSVLLDLYPACAEELYSDVVIIYVILLVFPCYMDLYHLRQGLHVIAASWDYHGGAESRVSVCGNSVRFTFMGEGSGAGGTGAGMVLSRPRSASLDCTMPGMAAQCWS